MVSSDRYNQTTFGIESHFERYSWVVYHFFVLLSSLIGDTLILYASVKKCVFKLNKFVVTVIQYIAVTDLMYTLIGVLPRTIALLADSWVLGDELCYARVYLGYFFYQIGMCLIALLTTSKYLLLKFPIRCGNWAKKMAHRICILTSIPASISPVLFLVVDKNDVEFDYRTYTCDYMFKLNTSKKRVLHAASTLICLLNFIIVGTTIPTLKYLADARKSARRVQGSIPWQGAVAVALTAVVYCISTLPSVIYYTLLALDFFQKSSASLLQIQFTRVAKFMQMINIVSNFYIYTLTIKSFRGYLLSRVTSVQPLVSKPSRNMASPGKNCKITSDNLASNSV